MNPAVVIYAIQGLNAILAAAPAAIDLVARIQQHRSNLERMQAENRGPTDAEWAELDAQTQNLRKQLHS